MTQWPSLEAFSMASSATDSWPCPRDTLWSFPRSIVKPSFFPKHTKHAQKYTQAFFTMSVHTLIYLNYGLLFNWIMYEIKEELV